MDGLALVFMRAITGVEVNKYSIRPSAFGVPAASFVGISQLDNRLNTTAEVSAEFETTHGAT